MLHISGTRHNETKISGEFWDFDHLYFWIDILLSERYSFHNSALHYLMITFEPLWMKTPFVGFSMRRPLRS